MLIGERVIVCDRSGRIYQLDQSDLVVADLPLKGYRDVQLTSIGDKNN